MPQPPGRVLLARRQALDSLDGPIFLQGTLDRTRMEANRVGPTTDDCSQLID